MAVRACGDLVIQDSGRIIRNVPGETTRREPSIGKFHIFSVMDGKGMAIDLAYATWGNGDIDIRPNNVVSNDQALLRLAHSRMRMTVRDYDGNLAWVELSQARILPNTPTHWSTRRRASIDELNNGADLDVEQLLIDAGAVAVDMKQTAINDFGRRRNFYCALFPKDNRDCPVTAFVLTRILPIMHGYSG